MRYEEHFTNIDAVIELVKELKEDKNVSNIETIKMGDGYLVTWNEKEE